MDIAAQRRHLFDEAGADVGVTIFGHEKERRDIGRETVVHVAHLELVLEVGNGAQAGYGIIRSCLWYCQYVRERFKLFVWRLVFSA